VKRSGWLTFSAAVLIIAGIMRVLNVIWAFRYGGAIPDNLQGAIFGHSLTTYGWVWLIVGAVLIAAGYLVLSPSARLSAELARWQGW
jgi:predicted anti-sigma-YlaC factor YlaD